MKTLRFVPTKYILFTLLATNLKAAYIDTQVSIDYDDCSGAIIVTFLGANRETCGFQDRIADINLEWQTPSGARGTFFYMTDNENENKFSGMEGVTFFNENVTCDVFEEYWRTPGAFFSRDCGIT